MARIAMPLALVLALGLFAQTSMACNQNAFVTGVSATTIMAPRNPNSTAVPYTDAQVEEALMGFGAYATNENGSPRYLVGADTTYACVDSRGEDDPSIDKLQTPGGDISEFAMGIVVYARMMGIANVTMDHVFDMLVSFMNYTITYERPFYYHTDVVKLNYAFEQYAEIMRATSNQTNVSVPVVLPNYMPEDPAEAAAWMIALSDSSNQGCGHVRLTMTYPEQYGLTPDEESILPDLVKSFYTWWWPTESGSMERNKAFFSILPGGLEGASVAVINNTGPACEGYYPEVVPAHGGSTMFIYQGAAVAEFRAQTIGPFFEMYAMQDGQGHQFDMDVFMEMLTSLAGTQLVSTLTLLAPVDGLPVVQVDLTSEVLLL